MASDARDARTYLVRVEGGRRKATQDVMEDEAVKAMLARTGLDPTDQLVRELLPILLARRDPKKTGNLLVEWPFDSSREIQLTAMLIVSRLEQHPPEVAQVVCIVDDEETGNLIWNAVHALARDLPDVKMVNLVGKKLFGASQVNGTIVIGTPATVARSMGGMSSIDVKRVSLLLFVQRKAAHLGRYDVQYAKQQTEGLALEPTFIWLCSSIPDDWSGTANDFVGHSSPRVVVELEDDPSTPEPGEVAPLPTVDKPSQPEPTAESPDPAPRLDESDAAPQPEQPQAEGWGTPEPGQEPPTLSDPAPAQFADAPAVDSESIAPEPARDIVVSQPEEFQLDATPIVAATSPQADELLVAAQPGPAPPAIEAITAPTVDDQAQLPAPVDQVSDASPPTHAGDSLVAAQLEAPAISNEASTAPTVDDLAEELASVSLAVEAAAVEPTSDAASAPKIDSTPAEQPADVTSATQLDPPAEHASVDELGSPPAAQRAPERIEQDVAPAFQDDSAQAFEPAAKLGDAAPHELEEAADAPQVGEAVAEEVPQATTAAAAEDSAVTLSPQQGAEPAPADATASPDVSAVRAEPTSATVIPQLNVEAPLFSPRSAAAAVLSPVAATFAPQQSASAEVQTPSTTSRKLSLNAPEWTPPTSQPAAEALQLPAPSRQLSFGAPEFKPEANGTAANKHFSPSGRLVATSPEFPRPPTAQPIVTAARVLGAPAFVPAFTSAASFSSIAAPFVPGANGFYPASVPTETSLPALQPSAPIRIAPPTKAIPIVSPVASPPQPVVKKLTPDAPAFKPSSPTQQLNGSSLPATTESPESVKLAASTNGHSSPDSRSPSRVTAQLDALLATIDNAPLMESDTSSSSIGTQISANGVRTVADSPATEFAVERPAKLPSPPPVEDKLIQSAELEQVLGEFGWESPSDLQFELLPLIATGRSVVLETAPRCTTTTTLAIAAVDTMARLPGDVVWIMPSADLRQSVRLARQLATAAPHIDVIEAQVRQRLDAQRSRLIIGTPAAVVSQLLYGAVRPNMTRMLIIEASQAHLLDSETLTLLLTAHDVIKASNPSSQIITSSLNIGMLPRQLTFDAQPLRVEIDTDVAKIVQEAERAVSDQRFQRIDALRTVLAPTRGSTEGLTVVICADRSTVRDACGAREMDSDDVMVVANGPSPQALRDIEVRCAHGRCRVLIVTYAELLRFSSLISLAISTIVLCVVGLHTATDADSFGLPTTSRPRPKAYIAATLRACGQLNQLTHTERLLPPTPANFESLLLINDEPGCFGDTKRTPRPARPRLHIILDQQQSVSLDSLTGFHHHSRNQSSTNGTTTSDDGPSPQPASVTTTINDAAQITSSSSVDRPAHTTSHSDLISL